MAQEAKAPAQIGDGSIRLQQGLDGPISPTSLAIADICQKMLAGLLVLQDEC